MELRGKHVVVIGLARTGNSLAEFLLAAGARVTISEKRTAEALGPERAAWIERGAVVECGGHDPATFLAADLIVPSPGVPKLAEIETARKTLEQNRQQLELADVTAEYRQLATKHKQMLDNYLQAYGTNKEKVALHDLVAVLDQIVTNRDRAATLGDKTASTQLTQYRAELEKYKRK